MTETIMKYSVWFFVIYAVLPTVLVRFCHLGAIWRPANKGRVSITFDDGPDPRYTPRVLDILKENNIKACFFVLGEKASRHPELMTRIISEGHEIGSHGFKHRFPWLLGPVGTLREIKHASSAIKNSINQHPLLFRPPWGLLNIFSFILFSFSPSRLKEHKLVLWSFMSWDWSKGCTPDKIASFVLRRVKEGAILVFHDSDTVPGAAPGAPEKMLDSLPGIINQIQLKGLQITPLKEMIQTKPPGKRLMIWLWSFWDSIVLRLAGVEQVTVNGRPTLFRLAVRKYTGPEIKMPCGTYLRQGRRICELHLNNDIVAELLAGETKPEKIAVRIVRELRRSLPALAKFVSEEPKYKDIQVIAGVTMLHRATEKMGFVSADIKSGTMKRIIGFYQSLILRIYHPAGKKRFAGQEGRLEPKIVAISKKSLLQKAGRWSSV
ncbi:N-acetylglucosamine deacetylase [Desulfocucumis palustris]|uniref:N-acetylglucosamine deacetylase n=1 Tax=Desulfocucumis palustris TaxID=1898651 RepID=A0A2L2XE29_9FIRM|nr:polysaccharide deacetylase family protein [Desulfocucumis palustris]GBF34485.1 N-acetylglucosamine deacetylase [Desulfocucumis palustris]